MKEYLDIVSNVLSNGHKKENRTGVDTISLPHQIFQHDMSCGFPLLTTKKMPIKTILVELEGFIAGITDKSWYQQRGCRIWNEWANPEKVNKKFFNILHSLNKDSAELNESEQRELKKDLQKEERDLGPLYGFQWRNFGGTYRSYDDYDNDGIDQLKNIVDTLHKNPNDRRMVCSAWSPGQIFQMALPPCHYAWSVQVINNKLNLIWHQRSCDLMLGVPFNIASYATLLLLLSRDSGIKPGILTGSLEDCHIYVNQIDGANEQLSREPKILPKLNTHFDEPKSLPNKNRILVWHHQIAKLENYNPWPKIDFGGVAV